MANDELVEGLIGAIVGGIGAGDDQRPRPSRRPGPDTGSAAAKIFDLAAHAVIGARLLRSNADAVIEAAIKKEIEIDANPREPALT